MPLFVRKFRAHKRAHQILGQRYANDTGTQHKNIDIVVLHALMRGIGVMRNAGADARQFVRRHRRADAAAADQNAAIGASFKHGKTYSFGIIRIIHRIRAIGTEIENAVVEGF